MRPLATGAAAPGEVLAAGDELTVACGEGALALLELQRPGGRRMTAAEFLRGRKPAPGLASSCRRAGRAGRRGLSLRRDAASADAADLNSGAPTHLSRCAERAHYVKARAKCSTC